MILEQVHYGKYMGQPSTCCFSCRCYEVAPIQSLPVPQVSKSGGKQWVRRRDASHTAARRSSCEKALSRFFNLREEITCSLHKRLPLTTTVQWRALWKSAFCLDLWDHMNRVNVKLQGEAHLIHGHKKASGQNCMLRGRCKIESGIIFVADPMISAETKAAFSFLTATRIIGDLYTHNIDRDSLTLTPGRGNYKYTQIYLAAMWLDCQVLFN